jgi:hypothetical protein
MHAPHAYLRCRQVGLGLSLDSLAICLSEYGRATRPGQIFKAWNRAIISQPPTLYSILPNTHLLHNIRARLPIRSTQEDFSPLVGR